MTSITDFYDLNAWKQAHKLVIEIYKITNTFPKEEKYSLTDQIRRASSSVTANIAEGFGRFHYPDRIHFYHQARGSLKEVQNFLILTKDINYINQSQFESLWQISKTSEMILNGLIKSAGTLKS
jgi:four helix bundle protein